MSGSLVGYVFGYMGVKLIIYPSRVDGLRLSTAIEKFETLGVCHNGEIICPTEIDAQVTEIIHSI